MGTPESVRRLGPAGLYPRSLELIQGRFVNGKRGRAKGYARVVWMRATGCASGPFERPLRLSTVFKVVSVLRTHGIDLRGCRSARCDFTRSRHNFRKDFLNRLLLLSGECLCASHSVIGSGLCRALLPNRRRRTQTYPRGPSCFAPCPLDPSWSSWADYHWPFSRLAPRRRSAEGVAL